MNENVQAFLDKKREAEEKKNKKEKQRVLLELGLFEKVYSEDSKRSKEFPLSEWDREAQCEKFYKNVPYEVTDEEYEQLVKYAEQEEPAACSNTIEMILFSLAWIIYIGGFLAGIFLSSQGYSFVWSTAIICWASAFVSGTIFLGFSEVIKLLEAIKNKL